MKKSFRRLIALGIVVAVLVHASAPAGASLGGASELVQQGYIFETDDSSADNKTQLAAGGTPIVNVNTGDAQQLVARVHLRNQAGAISSTNAALFYDRNDGIWSKVKSGGSATTGPGSCTDSKFQCTVVDSAGADGSYTSMAVDPSGNPWVSYYESGGDDLQVARYVGSGGSGCASAAWTCTIVDSAGLVGMWTSITIDAGGNPWVSYFDDTNNDLKVAHYVGAGGSGCASTEWTCTTVDGGTDVGEYTSIALDSSGDPWISYYDTNSDDLRVAEYVGSGGSGCTSSAWTCTTVVSAATTGRYTSIALGPAGDAWVSYTHGTDLAVAHHVGSGGSGCASAAWTCITLESTGSVGYDTGIAIDPAGNPWVSYAEGGAANNLKVAQYVGSGGSGCDTATWKCTAVDTNGDTGSWTSIAFDPAGKAWVSYGDYSTNDLRLARFAGSGGSGCASSEWNCTTVDEKDDVNLHTSIAFDSSGQGWISYSDTTNGDLKVANTYRGGEVRIGTSPHGATGDALNESHADMTAAGDTSNRDDADCLTGGATWNAGKFSESENLPSFSMPDGSTTQQCTELSFVLDLSQAYHGTTYRLAVATDDAWRDDKGRWRGPFATTTFATFTVRMTDSESSTMSIAVDPTLTFAVGTHAGACNGVSQSAGVSTSSTAVPLGAVSAIANRVGAQDLIVSTNAATGFTVFTRSTGTFNDGVGHVIDAIGGTNVSPGAFPSAGTEGFGYTTSDAVLGTGTANRFTNPSANWAALSGTNAEVSFGTGPVSNDTICVAYQVAISPVTEAGTYSATVVYTAVPLF